MEKNSRHLADELVVDVQKITQNINQIENLLQQIGTPRDSSDLRSKITNIQVDTKDLLSISQKKLKEFHNFSSSQNVEIRLKRERLTKELIKLIQKYEHLTKISFEKERNHVLIIENNPDISIENDHLLVVQDENQRQLKYEVLERQKRFTQLESDIVDLNAMFKDLAVMVHDQANIKGNIHSTQVTVVKANEEIADALTFQSKSRRSKFIFAFIIITILIIFIVTIILSLEPWKK